MRYLLSLVVSCGLLSTFALPSVCSPSSSPTSFVVASPSNAALLRDSTRFTDRLNQILFEINSILESEDQNEYDEEQEEIEDQQQIDQIEANETLEDSSEGDQIIGSINEAEAGPKTKTKTPKQIASEESYAASKKAVHAGLARVGKGARDVLLFPAYKAHQWVGQLQKRNSPEAKQARKEKRQQGQRPTHEKTTRQSRILPVAPDPSTSPQPHAVPSPEPEQVPLPVTVARSDQLKQTHKSSRRSRVRSDAPPIDTEAVPSPEPEKVPLPVTVARSDQLKQTHKNSRRSRVRSDSPPIDTDTLPPIDTDAVPPTSPQSDSASTSPKLLPGQELRTFTINGQQVQRVININP